MPTPRNMWAITINTSYGIREEDTAKLLKFFKKHRSFLITEKQGDKQHYHGGIYFEKECIQGNVRNQLLRCFPDFDDKQKQHAIKVKNWYNNDWYENYCTKDEDVNVLHDSYKPDFAEIVPFPDPDDKKDVRPIAGWYAKMEKMILDDDRYEEPYDETTILRAINTYQYSDRTIDIIPDPKQLQQKTRALVNYINKYSGPGYGYKRYRTEQQEEDDVDLCPKCDSCKIRRLQDLHPPK